MLIFSVFVVIRMNLRMKFEPLFTECLCFVGFDAFGVFKFNRLVSDIGAKDAASLPCDDSFRLVIHLNLTVVI